MQGSKNGLIEVDDRNFEEEVIEASRQIPVLVDFWAEWCAPCRALGPVLENLAREMKGAFRLAKVNTERSPALAQALQIRSIPLVVMFKDGRPVDQFVGALPEEEIRRFIQRHCRTESDDLVEKAVRHLEAGDEARAERILQTALASEPSHPSALLAMARIEFSRGALDAAEQGLARIVPDRQTAEGIEELRARIWFRRQCLELGTRDEAGLGGQFDTDSLESRFRRAVCMVDDGQFEEAFGLLLGLVREDRSFRDDGARKALVEAFKIVGVRSPLADKWRDRLTALLF